jgi:hypothetical protein
MGRDILTGGHRIVNPQTKPMQNAIYVTGAFIKELATIATCGIDGIAFQPNFATSFIRADSQGLCGRSTIGAL